MSRITAILVFAAVSTAAFSAEPVAVGKDSFVRVAPGGRGFVLGGKPWHPFGCNYFDPHVGWAPKLWQQFDAQRVEEHFRVIESLGVNVVRVFLTAQSFFSDPPNLDPAGAEKFDKMLAIARRHGIRVHPTGPDHWEGQPPWAQADMFADSKSLDAQAAFWKAFAARYRDDPTIFAYDLRNEPHIRWGGSAMHAAWREWLRERYSTIEALRKAWGAESEGIQSFDGVAIPRDQAAPNSAALLDFQRFRESLADRWVKVQADAIRANDPNHPITVGLIQWSVPVVLGRPSQYAAFRPSRIAPMLDFLSVHFYPLWGDPLNSQDDFDRNLAYLEMLLRYVRAGDPRKPLLVGEFGWYGGGRTNDRAAVRSAEDQSRWCRAAVVQGRGIAAGWLNWAYADTPSARDMTKFSGLVTEDGAPKAWGMAFQQLAKDPSVWAEGGNKPQAEVEFDVDRAITDPREGDAMLRRYLDSWKPAKRCGLAVR